MGVRLPAEYQEVEYLESTGTQYIDTGLVSNAPWKVLFDISFAQVNVMQMYTGCFHNYGDYSDIRNYLRVNANSTLAMHNARGLESALDGLVAIENTRYRIWGQLSTGTNMEALEIDNNRYLKQSAFIATNLPIYLFAICRKTSSSQVAGNFMFGKVYKAKYYDLSNVKTADFVPCYRKSDNKPGMYDLVTEQFFVNQGTGDDFVVGPDVIDSISPWLVAWRRIMMAAASVAKKLVKLVVTSTTGLVSFDTNVEMPVKVTCEFSPVQEGTGGPSPDNVRPISGWTGCNIFNRGDSFYNNKGLTYAAINTTVTVLAPDSINVRATSANYPASKQLLSNYNLVNGKTYVIAADVDVTSGIGRLTTRDSNNTIKASTNNITESGYYYLIFTYNSSTMNYLSFFCNFSESSGGNVTYRNIVFAEVNEQLPISWQSEAGTVYGGTVTLNEDGSADLVSEWVKVTLPSNLDGWTLRNSGTSSIGYWGHIAKNITNYYGNTPATGDNNGRFNVGNWRRNSPSSGTDWRSYWRSYTLNSRLNIIISAPTPINTKSLFSQHLKDMSLTLEMAYKLSTPTTYHFDNVGQLQSFIGTNNIWHDMNGDITVEYWNKQ